MPVYGHMSFSTDPRYVIHEAYVGKTPTLLEAEKQINKIRVNCKKFTDINKSPEVQALNRLIEKQFGMDVFALQIDQSNVINAYTLPIDTRFDVGLEHDISDFVIGDKKNGYRFKPNNGLGIICVMYLGVLNCEEFTDGEILAIMLHELGHNFSAAIYDRIKVANKKWVKEAYKYLLKNAIFKKSLEKQLYSNSSQQVIDQSKEKAKKSKGISNGISATFSNIGSFFRELGAKLGPSSLMWKLFFKTMSSSDKSRFKRESRNSVRRADEVIADKFAGVYGYGPEQVSALLKMEKHNSAASKFIDKIPLIGKIANANYFDATKEIYIFDEHPQTIQRAFEEIKLLEAELEKSDVDPKLRKIMKEQIKQMKDLIEEAIKLTDGGKKIDQLRAAFYEYISKKDPNAVADEVEKEIHEAMDKMLKKKG